MDSHHVQIGDLRVHYLEGGTGPPLVMLHGGTLSAERGVQRGIYEPQLTDRFRVLAPDHRGHGGTVNPKPEITLEQLVVDTIGFCRALGLERPVLWGFSLGADVALEVGRREPDLPGGLVFQAGNIVKTERTFQRIERWFGITAAGVDLAFIEREIPGLPEFWRSLHAPQGPHHWKTLLPQLHGLLFMPLDRMQADLSAVTVPTLVVSGDRDEFYPPEDVLPFYRRLRDAELAIVPGHPHHMLGPAGVALVADFIARRVLTSA